jgi:hypothetical protein
MSAADATSNRASLSSAMAVRPEDLGHLPTLHQILAHLNDPAASAAPLIDLCRRLPSLAARIIAEAHRVAPHHGVARVDFALTLVGNRGLERVLMTYLEDLTILKSELEDGPISQR